MSYEAVLRWSLAPTVFLFVLSLACIALTTHYWIIGEFLMYRGIDVNSFDTRMMKLDWEVTIIDYASCATDTTIISGFMGLFTGIVCFLAWYKLRRADMDLQCNLPRRRFWVSFACLALFASFASAIAALVFHYTEKGSDEYGCNRSITSRGDRVLYCTREMGACNVLPELKRLVTEEWKGTWDRPWAVAMACTEIQAVKWMQLVSVVTSTCVMGMLGAQAWVRRKARSREADKGKEREAVIR